LEILEVAESACLGSLPDQLPLTLCGGSQDVEKEAGCWISIVGVEGLGDGDESHTVASILAFF
jgi:hypothetical protein